MGDGNICAEDDVADAGGLCDVGVMIMAPKHLAKDEFRSVPAQRVLRHDRRRDGLRADAAPAHVCAALAVAAVVAWHLGHAPASSHPGRLWNRRVFQQVRLSPLLPVSASNDHHRRRIHEGASHDRHGNVRRRVADLLVAKRVRSERASGRRLPRSDSRVRGGTGRIRAHRPVNQSGYCGLMSLIIVATCGLLLL